MKTYVKNTSVEESPTLWSVRMTLQYVYFYCLNYFRAPLNVAICVKYFVPICLRIYKKNYADGGSKPTTGSVIFFSNYAQNVHEIQLAPCRCGTECNSKYCEMTVESRNGGAGADVHC
jgi:hypothetical protein